MRAIACGLLLVALPACWADFPDSRFRRDVALADAADAGDAARADSRPDVAPDVQGEAMTCTPNSFVDCTPQGALVKCNALGTGTVEVACAPGTCVAALGRCDQCDPETPPSCSGSDLVSCTPDGIEETEPCPLGCWPAEHKCCANEDQDTINDCDGDCNDNDPLVYPGQTEFQTTATSGSFDYNCDGQEEKEHPDLHTYCQTDGGGCTGEGWQASVPACGGQGTFVACTRHSNHCDTETGVTATQGCR